MDVTLLASAGEALVALTELSDWCDEMHIAVAWASSTSGTAPHWRALDLAKLRRGLVGVHFHQTEPHALQALRRLGVLKVISDPTGVFHPKLIIGRSGGRVRALVGSSNLTSGGFSGNTELGVLIDADEEDAEIVRLLALMDELWSRTSAFVPDDRWMDWYEKRYRRRPKPQATSGPVPDSSHPSTDTLGLDWSGYFSELLTHQGRLSIHGNPLRVFQKQKSYRSEIRCCRQAFRDHHSFSTIPQRERALVGGFGGGSSGYLGNMGRAIQFRDLVANRPGDIAPALDSLPAQGPVSAATIERVVHELFDISGVGLPSGTRLLAVKRPDLFFPVNNANIERVNETLGQLRASDRHRAGDYLAVLASIRNTAWWTAAKPDDTCQRRAWLARVALLDVLLYSV